jgi:hypothetical protein
MNMGIVGQFRKVLTILLSVLILTTTVACSGAVEAKQPPSPSGISRAQEFASLERGNSEAGQNFGDWVVQTGQGLVKDAYVRDNNKLGVVITPQVRPDEVRSLAKSLLQGFHRNFPSRDLTVLMYAPDKKLVLTANYDTQSNRIEYQ